MKRGLRWPESFSVGNKPVPRPPPQGLLPKYVHELTDEQIVEEHLRRMAKKQEGTDA